MPGLKPDEWQEWNAENLSKQEVIAESNVNILLNRLWEIGLDRKYHDKFKNRLAKWKVSPSVYMQKVSTRMIFDLQTDLTALEYFISQKGKEAVDQIDFDLGIGVFPQIQGILYNGTNLTDLQPTFPQMTLDSIKAVLTDGNEPPAEDMQKAQEYFAERAAQSMQSTEL